ncbi:MAG: agmatine deiminase family protein [bacterium]
MIGWKAFFGILICALLLAACCCRIGFAEEPVTRPANSWNVERGIELPIGKTEWEIANEYLFPIIYPTDDPPPAPVVQCAEWEAMSGVLIRYPLGISTSIIREMAEDVVVTTIVSSSSQQQSVYNQYQSAGVNMANTDWLIAPSNSIWTRDYGPWFTFTGDDVQGITDHIYNRPTRPDDNNIPWVYGAAEGIPVYGMPLTHTGGNYMCDGMGTAMSTNLVYNENSGMSTTQIQQYIYDYCGVDNYIVMPDILSSGIHHIDCWAKMLDPGRILVKRLSPPNTQLETNVAMFQSTMSSYGRPYEVIRVDCYSSTPYTNSLILDNKVLVPIFGGSLDAQALQTYEDAMPGYEILGVSGSWVSDDAIHCRTMGIADRYMLRVVHVPLLDQENTGSGYLVEAEVHPYSNQALLTGMPQIIWRVGAGSYNTVSMTAQGNDLYTGTIPMQADYSTISYYLHAEDVSGRSEDHPYIGSGNPHQFMVFPSTALNVVVTPENPPIVIPSSGGSFNYTIQVSNTGSGAITADIWCNITLPNGRTSNPTLGPIRNFILNGNWSTSRNRTQSIPGSAPAGNYTYNGYLGFYPNVIFAQHSFPFSKSGVDGVGDWSEGWTCSGETFTADEGISLMNMPTGFVLQEAYPNPFNPLTTLGFMLPQAAQVKLAVYDVSGKRVAELVNGWRQVGTHEVTFDASGLASGMYLYRLEAEGFSATGKLLLVK